MENHFFSKILKVISVINSGLYIIVIHLFLRISGHEKIYGIL